MLIAIFCVLCIVAIGLSEYDGWKVGVLCLISIAVACVTYGTSPSELLAVLTTKNFLMWFLGYAIVGFLYAIGKWTRHVYSSRDLYLRLRREFNEEEASRSKLNGFRPSWSSYLKANGYDANPESDDVIPNINHNKNRFMRWMIWWPFNVIFTFFNDPFRWFFETLYEFGHRTLQRIATSTFNNSNITEEQ